MTTQPESVNLLIFSDDVTVREAIITAVGRRAGKGLPTVEWTQCATADGVRLALAEKEFAVLVLDAESPKLGGMGLAKELNQEMDNCPPVLLLVARQQDEWLGQWSGAAAIVSEPFDSIEMQETIAALLRQRLGL
ncbi:hypothetical protein ABYF34_06370 [Buchananella felis]|uniref:hypothetical protein n=1 Tax=Buchananella felis TaxID=3231492 RepID=UPI003527E23E